MLGEGNLLEKNGGCFVMLQCFCNDLQFNMIDELVQSCVDTASKSSLLL